MNFVDALFRLLHPGLIERGNINLRNRPRVRNADGSVSTVLSMSIGTDEGEVLIPKIRDDGREMEEAEAIQAYFDTRRHLGKFETPEAATRYAKQLHELQAAGNSVNELLRQRRRR